MSLNFGFSVVVQSGHHRHPNTVKAAEQLQECIHFFGPLYIPILPICLHGVDMYNSLFPVFIIVTVHCVKSGTLQYSHTSLNDGDTF